MVGAFIGAAIGGIGSAITQYATTGDINWEVVATDTYSGAATGLLASTGVGIFGSVIGNAAISGATYIAEQTVQGKDVNPNELFYSTVIGGSAGAIGGAGAKASRLEVIWNRSRYNTFIYN